MRPDSSDSPDAPDSSWSDTGAEDSGIQPAAEETGLDVDSMVPQFESEAQQRLWLRALIPLLQLRSHDVDPSCRVQFAFDQMYILTCERITRILRGDLAEAAEE